MYAKLNPETLGEDENGMWYKVDERESNGRDVSLISFEYIEEARISETQVEVATYRFNEGTLEYDEFSKETVEKPLPQPGPTAEQQIEVLKQKLVETEATMVQRDKENKNALFEIYSMLLANDAKSI
ncbi:hypothetical protein [Gorillibacterium sp. sgz500922]|uniref:hypothetical protein n=1 Tax=Gorillibacterium sp. sgz500922 TaxID=3446694 RepID=UPI003F676092